jgi:hypothetical protein
MITMGIDACFSHLRAIFLKHQFAPLRVRLGTAGPVVRGGGAVCRSAHRCRATSPSNSKSG